jgi:GT2 family glycosyltransferase/glycosyltransferase involved in cell wall biosynthesis
VPVTVVIPTYGDPSEVVAAVRSVRATTRRRLVRIVVVDDASPAPDQARLRAELEGKAEVILGEENLGFAGNVNRGLRAATGDVVVLNSDVLATDNSWLECLQYAAYRGHHDGVVGPKLLYPDGRIQSAGSYRPAGGPEFFDHRYRFKPADHGPANAVFPALAVTGAAMYITREALEAVGPMDERFGMAFEDVDWCLRAWVAGYRVVYDPVGELIHAEAVTRGTDVGEREAASRDYFWQKWGDWFDRRDVRTPDGRLRIVYVTQDTGVGGGHREVFEHVNRLRERGHEVELWSLEGPPDWFDLRVPVKAFATYDELADALGREDAIKVATWWDTARAVWMGALPRGAAAYFVQDIETSYYPDDPRRQEAVLATYREEFAFFTTSTWNRDRLTELGVAEVELVPPGIDLETFRPLEGLRRDDVLLAVGRSHPLKNIELTLEAFKRLPPDSAELWMFGVEPELGERSGGRYVLSPSDAEVNRLFNQATVFVQTSRHEGFCLPPLEAMATGGAVVCTDAHGNRDFCRDGENCLMPEATPEAVGAAIRRLLGDPQLRTRLGEAGLATARDHAWERRIDGLERFFERLADRVAAGPSRRAEAERAPR